MFYYHMSLRDGSLHQVESGEFRSDLEDIVVVEHDEGVYRIRDFDGEVLVETTVGNDLLALWDAL